MAALATLDSHRGFRKDSAWCSASQTATESSSSSSIPLKRIGEAGRNETHFATVLPMDDSTEVSGLKVNAEVYILLNGKSCLEQGVTLLRSINNYALTRDEIPLSCVQVAVDTREWVTLFPTRGDPAPLWTQDLLGHIGKRRVRQGLTEQVFEQAAQAARTALQCRRRKETKS